MPQTIHLSQQLQIVQQQQQSTVIITQQQQQHQQNSCLLLERRIVELLTGTNLTFKQIISKLDDENLSASIGIIRRINRDNRYRRPRYDSKLTPAQRESLVEELRDHDGLKPNLSLLAKRYGVCHGSVWYWWDKLNRIGRCGASGGTAVKRGLTSKRNEMLRTYGRKQPQQRQQHAFLSGDGGARRVKQRGARHLSSGSDDLVDKTTQVSGTDEDEDVDYGVGGSCSVERNNPRQRASSFNNFLLDNQKYNYVGRVRIVTQEKSQVINLPILMFSKRVQIAAQVELDLFKNCTSPSTSPSSSSSLVSADESFEISSSSSPTPLVVVDDDDDDEFGSLLGSPPLSLSSSLSPPQLATIESGASEVEDGTRAAVKQLDLSDAGRATVAIADSL